MEKNRILLSWFREKKKKRKYNKQKHKKLLSALHEAPTFARNIMDFGHRKSYFQLLRCE